MRLAAIALLLAACAPLEVIPNQPEAETIVWRETYHAACLALPRIEWVHQDRLDCVSDGVRFRGFTRGTDCWGGYYNTASDTAHIALPDGYPFSGIGFAHELYHAYLARLGDADVDHMSDGFKAGGIVDQANAALLAHGL